MRAFPALLIAAGLVLSAGAASAQAPTPAPHTAPMMAKPAMTPEMQQARMDMQRVCRPEMQRLCPGGKGTDKAARHQCVKDHRKDVSAACQQAKAKMKQMRHAQKRG